MTDADLWVFGYGSLMWNPGFEYDRRELATLTGYARTFCMWSIHHRGTPEHPGLVLALDPHEDAECHGLGFRVPGLHRARTLDYLRERELVSSAYVERMLPLRLADGEEVEAVVSRGARERSRQGGLASRGAGRRRAARAGRT